MFGPREEHFLEGETHAYLKARPADKCAYSPVELGIIWDMEVAIKDVAWGNAGAYDQHTYYHEKRLTLAPHSGITHKLAIELITRAGKAELLATPIWAEPRPANWPCEIHQENNDQDNDGA